MAYLLTITEEPGYLHFRVAGDNALATVRAYVAEVHATCAQRGCRAILVEENLTGPGLEMLDIFQIVSTGVEETRLLLRKIAFVDLQARSRPGNARFAETVAVNRGLNLRTFATVAEAAAWLTGSLEA